MLDQDGFTVEVSYLIDKVDLQEYIFTNQIIKKTWKLKDQLERFVEKYLRERIQFAKKSNQASIIDQKIRVSNQSGHFQFDPMLFMVEFKLQNLMDRFDEFQLGENKRIQFNYIAHPGNYLPNQKIENIQGKTEISVILDRVAQKFSISEHVLQIYKKRFKLQYLNRVSDLKVLSQQEFLKTFSDIPRKILNEIYQQISRIDCYREGFHESKKLKELDPEGKNYCLRLSNGHKLLRYFIYKNKTQQLKEIPCLNWQAVKNARQIIKGIISLDKQTWNRIDDFLIQFCLPHNNNYEYSRGAIFNGPPGTGKTVITELLITLCGFFQISKGISAADFMKSLVGEAGRFIQGLFSRADVCPWLATFISIDQIQSAFPRRDSEESKNKGELISKFLSMIEGNKNVPNLFILSATNHIDKIDQAVLRRLGDRNDLSRLNWDQRQSIFIKHFSHQLKLYEPYKDRILNYTMNFTGAALVKLLSQLENKRLAKSYFDHQPNQKLSDQQIMNIIEKTAKEYKIFFGSKTFPGLVDQNIKLKRYMNPNFLQKLDYSFMFIGFNRLNLSKINLFYFNKILIRNGKEIQQKRELEKICFNTFEDTQKLKNDHIQFFKQQFEICFQIQKIIICKNIKDANEQYQKVDGLEPIIFLITDQVAIVTNQKGPTQILQSLKSYKEDKKNVYFIYICQFEDVSQYVGHQENPKIYSGRVMVEVNESPQIVYETERKFPQEAPFYIQHYLPADTKPVSTDLNDVILQFLNRKKINNIFMIDNQFLESKGSFSNEKECQTIKGVIEEAKELASVAVIIDFDSLLLNNNKTKSLNKDEQQFDVDNKNLYKTLINKCKNFPCITQYIQRWLVIIGLDNKFIKKIRKDIGWPQMPEQKKERLEEEELNRKRTCHRCGQQYTQKENLEQKKCAQHPGIIINTIQKKQAQSTLNNCLRLNKSQEIKNQNQTDANQWPYFVYSCCLENVKEFENYCSKKHLFRHIQSKDVSTPKDELFVMKKIQRNELPQIIKYIQKNNEEYSYN